MMSRAITRRAKTAGFVAVLAAVAVLLTSPTAGAVHYGSKTITTNTTLTDDQYGNIIFAADNITLDCAGWVVHTSSYTPATCGGTAGKCAIVVNGRSNVVIRNCDTVGAFDFGVWIKDSSTVTVMNVTTTANTGFYVLNTSHARFGNAANANDGCWAASSDVDGFKLYPSDVAFLWNPMVTNAADDGFDLRAATAEFYLASADWSGGNGFESTNGTPYYDSVEASFNSHAGIRAKDGLGGYIRNADLQQNAGYGISVSNLDNWDFEDNYSHFNDDDSDTQCDVSQDAESTGNSWLQNDFGRCCGSVPDSPGDQCDIVH